MKRYLKVLRNIISIFLITIALPSLAQEEIKTDQREKTFLPQTYVESILSTHQRKSTDMFREQPVEAIIIIRGNRYIKTYGGKVSEAHTKKLDGKMEIVSVNQLLNLMYFQVDDFKNARFFINQTDKDSFTLDIVDGDRREAISFISSINGYQFEEQETSYTKFLLNGSYVLLDEDKKSTITFDLNGNISDNEHWDNYVVEGVYKYSKHKPGSFKSITLISKTGDERLNLAFTYYRDTKSWEGFAYETIIGNEINIKEGKTVRLIRK